MAAKCDLCGKSRDRRRFKADDRVYHLHEERKDCKEDDSQADPRSSGRLILHLATMPRSQLAAGAFAVSLLLPLQITYS